MIVLIRTPVPLQNGVGGKEIGCAACSALLRYGQGQEEELWGNVRTLLDADPTLLCLNRLRLSGEVGGALSEPSRARLITSLRGSA